MNQDKIIIDISDKIVNFYLNKEITEYKNTGKQLTGKYGILTNRQIPGIYSNITNKQSINTILINAIKYSLFSNVKAQSSTEMTELSEVYERTKIALKIQERKKNTENTTKYDEEIKIKKEILATLETKIKDITDKIDEIPHSNKQILNNAEQAYECLLRGDYTSKEIYILVCKKLRINLNISEHFGYDNSRYNNNYTNSRYNNNYTNSRYNNNQQSKDKTSPYIPPVLR
jgi:hypothetical protein